MEKTITIKISEDEVKAFTSVLVDTSDYYSTLNNNKVELNNLRNVTELKSKIIECYYDVENIKSDDSKYLKLPIEELPLSLFTINLLKGIDIFIVGDLVNYTPERLAKFRNLKGKRIGIIEKALSEIGLKLAVEKRAKKR